MLVTDRLARAAFDPTAPVKTIVPLPAFTASPCAPAVDASAVEPKLTAPFVAELSITIIAALSVTGAEEAKATVPAPGVAVDSLPPSRVLPL